MADAATTLSDLAARFAEMGVAVERLPGGRSLRGKLPLSATPFVSLDGARRYETLPPMWKLPQNS